MSTSKPHRSPVALSIAGSDPSGGAGLQADLKVFHQFGVYGMSVVSLLTVQNTMSVARVEPVETGFFEEQLRAVLDDIPPHAAKTGALGNESIVRSLAKSAASFEFPLVVDPAAVSTQGARLLSEEAVVALREELVPQAYLLTPNLPEAELLTGLKVTNTEQMRDAARTLQKLGARNVLIKGGHLNTSSIDMLLSEDERLLEFPSERIETVHTHGTGCALSAAITAMLAQDVELETAVGRAKSFISEAIRTAPQLGHGKGPTNLFTKA